MDRYVAELRKYNPQWSLEKTIDGIYGHEQRHMKRYEKWADDIKHVIEKQGIEELPYSSKSVCQCYANKLKREIEKSYKKFEEVQIHHDPTIYKRLTGGYYTTPKTATTKYRPLNTRPAPSY